MLFHGKEDSGHSTIRNEHSNIQYRLNGVTIPQSFAGFGAQVDPRVASSVGGADRRASCAIGLSHSRCGFAQDPQDSFDFDGDIDIYGGANGTIHGTTEQSRGFGYLSWLLGDNSRLTAFGGTSIGRFQFPNSPGIAPGFTFNGRTAFDSASFDQNQKQTTHTHVLTYQYSGDGFSPVKPLAWYCRMNGQSV